MARGTMHAPKENKHGRSKGVHTDRIIVEDDGVERGPALEDLTGRSDWPYGVQVWYRTWRLAPQAQAFEETDWLRLAMLAPIVEKHLGTPSAAALSEIRLNEERLGATVIDRMRARMTVERADDGDDGPGLASVTSIDGDSDDDILEDL